MRKALLLFAVLGLAGPLWAADPIIGTWKLNIAKSKFSPVLLALQKQEAPKERTEVYRELDNGQIEFGINRSYTWPRQGGAAKVPKDYPYAVIEMLIAPGEWYAIFLKDGIQARVIHKIVSKDGNTMTQTTNVVLFGQTIEEITVYDKQ
jgi:hypothetical protein